MSSSTRVFPSYFFKVLAAAIVIIWAILHYVFKTVFKGLSWLARIII